MKKKKQIVALTVSLIMTIGTGFSQTIPVDSVYLGQPRPADTPLLFAPGIVSLPGRAENRITFSSDGKMCFFSIVGGATYFVEYKNDHWLAPQLKSNKYGGEPFFSLDSKRVYLNSKNAINQVGTCDISYSANTDTVWADPISLGSPLNSSQGQWHPCIVADSSVYFSSTNGPIYRSQWRNGRYESPVPVPYPINGVSGNTWGDPYVSAEESYIIFRSGRAGGYGSIDLYISYNKTDGTWTNPKNLGSAINTSGEEYSGDVTPDGKYMTFGRGGDLYWVSTGFVDILKHTNFVPYLKTQISAQHDTVGYSFSYRIADSTFVDDDGNSTLTYSATASNGSALPAWMQFDSTTGSFSGIPTASGTFGVKVNATDTANASVSCTFNFIVTNPTGVEETRNISKEIQLFQNYPNPFNPKTVISYQLPVVSRVTLRVYDLLGREVATFAEGMKEAGAYTATFDGAQLAGGVYLIQFLAKPVDGSKPAILTKKMLLTK